MKIAVAGGGYVGLSLATLLAQKNEVVVLEPMGTDQSALPDQFKRYTSYF